VSVALLAQTGSGAFADPTCSNDCTPGATQCDSSGNMQTCEQVASGGTPGCSSAAELIYVVDEDNTFSSFQPGSPPVFTKIGTLNCPANGGATPFSMSVDRNAVAWVLYNDGELFNVDTQNATCTSTSYQSGQQGFTNFGMGFVSDTSGGATDTLYIANNKDLGTLNTSTLQVSKVGTVNGQPELTGTGLAQLFGFFPDPTNPRVSPLDTGTGAEGTPMPLQPLAGNPEAWAFAYYGGDFWIFLERFNKDNSTNVWHLVGSTGAVTEAMSNTGRTIVGAGESTCVPTSFCDEWVSTPCSSNKACSNGQCVLTCTDDCVAGQVQCSGTSLQTCKMQSSGCLGWDTTSCGLGSACTNGACVATCSNTCIPFFSQCADGTDTETCTLQSSGCWDWDVTPCASGQICNNAQCATSCTDVCTLGATQCSQTVPQTCAEGPSGCTQWENGNDCGSVGCGGGACCPCTLGQTQCAADGSLQVCQGSNEISGGCPDWVTTPCSTSCQGGSCLSACNPGSELNTCADGQSCVAIGSGYYCATVEPDGGIVTTNSGSASGNASGGSGNGNASGGNGNASASGAAGGTGGSDTGTAGTTGSAGAAAGSTGGSTTGAPFTTGSTGTSSGKPATATASGCGCGPSGTGSFPELALALTALLGWRRRRSSGA
jgi:hypothetical protein